MLVFDRINSTFRPELDNIALANQTEAIRPHRQGIFDTRTAFQRFVGDSVHPFVFRIPSRGVDVVSELAFHVDEAAAAGAVGPVVEGGERDGVSVAIHSRHPGVLLSARLIPPSK